MKKTVKDKIKDKAKATKEKVKGKLKAAKACAALLLCGVVCGCMDTNPASRANSNRIGDIEPRVKIVFEEGACSNSVVVTVPVSLGDGVLASADSAGSTETQTATPTMDVKPDIDVRYNDAIAGASDASKAVLGSIGDGLDAVLALMQSKKSGTVEVTKKDGTTATVECENGQCSFCEDGSCDPK